MSDITRCDKCHGDGTTRTTEHKGVIVCENCGGRGWRATMRMKREDLRVKIGRETSAQYLAVTDEDLAELGYVKLDDFQLHVCPTDE